MRQHQLAINELNALRNKVCGQLIEIWVDRETKLRWEEDYYRVSAEQPKNLLDVYHRVMDFEFDRFKGIPIVWNAPAFRGVYSKGLEPWRAADEQRQLLEL